MPSEAQTPYDTTTMKLLTKKQEKEKIKGYAKGWSTLFLIFLLQVFCYHLKVWNYWHFLRVQIQKYKSNSLFSSFISGLNVFSAADFLHEFPSHPRRRRRRRRGGNHLLSALLKHLNNRQGMLHKIKACSWRTRSISCGNLALHSSLDQPAGSIVKYLGKHRENSTDKETARLREK